MERVAQECADPLAWAVRRRVPRRDVDALALRNPANERRVVVRMAAVCITRPKRGDRFEEQLTRREKARSALRETIEVGGPEARGARVVEVLRPGELREQLPEQAEEVAVRAHV